MFLSAYSSRKELRPHKQKHCIISTTCGYFTKPLSDFIDIPIGCFAISLSSLVIKLKEFSDPCLFQGYCGGLFAKNGNPPYGFFFFFNDA